MITPKLFAILPDYVTTPDGMAVDPEGDLILACPNYAAPSPSGRIVNFDNVTGAPHINTAHETPATISYLDVAQL